MLFDSMNSLKMSQQLINLSPINDRTTSPSSPAAAAPLIRVQQATPKCTFSVPFYAVNLPTKLESLGEENTVAIRRHEDLIFDNAKDALALVKKFKNARFKVFQNYEAALHFSQESGLLQELLSSPVQDSENKFNGESVDASFPSIKEQDLAKLRKVIETGNEILVTNFVETNPKYLITTCETPAILFVAARYNAVHVCCKTNQSQILQFLLNKIADKSYINRLFNDCNDFTITNRRNHLFDLYLNTPDKVAHDTPMHIACKFAAVDCLAILLDEPVCAIEKLNKDNKRPVDVICDRKGDSTVKRRIQALFENHFYLQIVTCSLEQDRLTVKISHSSKPVSDENTLEKSQKVRALAGPMSLACAQEIVQKLNNPANRSRSELAVRLTDASRGLQRIARFQCKSKGIEWKEYWTFLGEYVDIASEIGLAKLEQHLLNQQKSVRVKTSAISDEQKLNDLLFKLKLDDLYVLTNGNGQEENDEEEEEDEYYTPDSSQYLTPVSLQEENSEDVDTFEFYINGKTISEEDFIAATALINVDLSHYPMCQQWYDWVLSQLNEQRYNSLCQFEASNRSFNSGYLSFEDSTATSPIKLKEIRTPIKSPFRMKEIRTPLKSPFK